MNGRHFTAQANGWLNKQVSWWTIKGLFKQAGFSYRRVRKSLKSNRDALMFAFFAQEIKHLRALVEVDLWFYDESSFDLNLAAIYAWQSKGSQLSLPAQRGNILTVAGFMQTDKQITALKATISKAV